MSLIACGFEAIRGDSVGVGVRYSFHAIEAGVVANPLRRFQLIQRPLANREICEDCFKY